MMHIFRKGNILKYLILSLFLLHPGLILAQQSVGINEFMASNSSTLADGTGEYSDWIEIYNPTSETINLIDWTLTDKADNAQLWTFPDIELGSKEYLIVFASGKDISSPGAEFHANFKIDKEGEYLALFDSEGNKVNEFESFPALSSDHSYNFYNGEFVLSSTATPGEENIITGEENLSAPEFSKNHGYYDSSFDLEILYDDNEAQIYYTTDGSEPGTENGTLYADPIPVNTTTIIRAAAIKDGLKSIINTSTYLFIDNIVRQPEDPEGYPEQWGSYYESEGTATADYGMDWEVIRDSRYSDLIEESFLSLPALSIVTNKSYLFSHSTDPDTGGIYIYSGSYDSGLGFGWERPASVELFNSEDGLDFQENSAIEIHGGASRLAEKTPKHSFRLSFKDEYGKTKLNHPIFGEAAGDSFNQIVLRATYGNSWLHRSASERKHTLLLHDVWGKDTQLDMGQPAGHGRFVHLFINGMYWGVYNPTERIKEEFAERYLGGNEADFDIIKDYGEVAEGSGEAWNTLLDLTNKNLSADANYFRLTGKNPDGSDNPGYESYIDLENYIDYMIINFYGANWDWDHHNWVAIRNRVNPGKGFKFFSWDAEHILEDVNSNILDINYDARPSGFFQKLRDNEHFRRLFADRVQKHFYNNGALTPQAGKERLLRRADEIELAIIAESARWGDYRRDVHRDYPDGPFDLYTQEHWFDELTFLTDDYFPARGNVFIEQLREADLFPAYDAPEFFINNEPNAETVQSGDTLSMTPSYGTIYYTNDGTDPLKNREPAESAKEYDQPMVLVKNTHIKARLFYRDEWSALSEQIFSIPDGYDYLKITEIHYHPLPEDTIANGNFEFIELKNTGAESLPLSGLKFIDGINYEFPEAELAAGEFVVLAKNGTYFEQRYQFAPDGEFEGALDNSGERVVLADANNDTLIKIRYEDNSPWPKSADGSGYSLVPGEANPVGDQNDPLTWQASSEINGSPGRDDQVSIAIDDESNNRPSTFSLEQNYPNPFNPSTVISYQIPVNIEVSLKVYDLLGREVSTLVDGQVTTGKHQVSFDASELSSGVYIYQLQVGSEIMTKKMMLIK